MGTYEVPEDYDYFTGGFLETDEEGNVLPGQFTPNTLNHILFGVPLSEDNPNNPKNLEKRAKKE